MTKILLVEDDLGLNEGLTIALSKEGYQVIAALNGYEALNSLESSIDLAILDISLPDIEGYTVAKRIKTFSDIPIVFLTAKDQEEDMLRGYTMGCEDYITKPFSLAVLLERVKVVLRRQTVSQPELLHYGNLAFDLNNSLFTKNQQEIQLTATEMKLLSFLVSNQNCILTKEQILESVWSIDGEFVDENTLSVNIRRLRIKIEEDPKKPVWIKTVFGIGYKWCYDEIHH